MQFQMVSVVLILLAIPKIIASAIEDIAELKLYDGTGIDEPGINDISAASFIESLSLTSSNPVEALLQFAEIADRNLFEIYFNENYEEILKETASCGYFHNVIISCIKVGSIDSFSQIINNLSVSLIGPLIIIHCIDHGSIDILKLIIYQKDDFIYDWTWDYFEDENSYIKLFGQDSFSASMFLGAINSIEKYHLECLDILIPYNIDVEWKYFHLLKLAAKKKYLKCFEIIFHAARSRQLYSSNFVMNEVLQIAIISNNEELVLYILRLDFSYAAAEHLKAGISSGNLNIMTALIIRVSIPRVSIEDIRDYAAKHGNYEMFLFLLKYLDEDVIMSGLLKYIGNPEFHHLVPLITKNIKLSCKNVSECLLESVKIESQEFIDLFLSIMGSDPKIVKEEFLTDLDSNNSDLINRGDPIIS